MQGDQRDRHEAVGEQHRQRKQGWRNAFASRIPRTRQGDSARDLRNGVAMWAGVAAGQCESCVGVRERESRAGLERLAAAVTRIVKALAGLEGFLGGSGWISMAVGTGTGSEVVRSGGKIERVIQI